MSDLSLPHHAADKVKLALSEIYQLTDDPGELLRIALMASSVCIGGAAGFLSGKAARKGMKISERDASLQIIEILRIMIADGPDALMKTLGIDAQNAQG